MSEYLLQMTGIDKRFGGVHALDHVNFAVRPGKVMCLAGENGCGKSTLVKILSGVYTRDEGEVLFEGKPIQHITPAESSALGIQVIYQDLSIFPNLTVMENLAINSEITANRKIVNRKRWEHTAKEALSKISSVLWLMNMMAMPESRSWRTVLNSASTSFLVRAVVGSSMMISLALNSSARQMATSCLSATDRSPIFAYRSMS